MLLVLWRAREREREISKQSVMTTTKKEVMNCCGETYVEQKNKSARWW